MPVYRKDRVSSRTSLEGVFFLDKDIMATFYNVPIDEAKVELYYTIYDDDFTSQVVIEGLTILEVYNQKGDLLEVSSYLLDRIQEDIIGNEVAWFSSVREDIEVACYINDERESNPFYVY